jgi:hypothetical protein
VSLEPNKIALAVLYYLYSDSDPAGEPLEIAEALGSGLSPGMVTSALEKLVSLGLVMWTGPMTMVVLGETIPGREWSSITDRGHGLVYRLIRQPKSFIGRLHREGFQWLLSADAAKAKLSVDLTNHGVEEYFDQKSGSKFDWTKSAAIAAWFIIPVTVVGICIAIWLDYN